MPEDYTPNVYVMERIRQREEERFERMYRARIGRIEGANEILAYWLNVAMSALVDIKCFSTDEVACEKASKAHRVYREGIKPFQEITMPEELIKFIKGDY